MTTIDHKKIKPSAMFRTLALASSIALLSACGGGGGSDVGSQNDETPPVASAAVVGLGQSLSTTNKTFQSRSNSQVVLTGKDSDSLVAPILDFNWQQTGGPTVTLVERTSNSVAFDTPDAATDSTLTFELTVTDANGNTDTDEITIEVSSISDADRFLADPRVPANKLTLLAALAGGESTGASSQAFTVEVVTIAHWRNQDGEMDELAVNTQIVDGVFPANFSPNVGYAALTEPRNPLVEIDLIRLDADEINKNFEDTDRQRRLESYEIPTAYLEIQISITSAPAINFELFALNNLETDTINGNDIEGSANGVAEILTTVHKTLPMTDRTRIDADKMDRVSATAASNGAIIQTSTGLMSTSLLTTNVLNELGLESHITASAYYNLIDPTGESSTFSGWAKKAGFYDDNNNLIDDPAIAHALYVNNYDLGFGRDMYLRKATDGNVYSYVTNYPTVEAGLEQRGEFAIVAMEYSENPDPDGANAKIVKFFVFSADERSGDFIRVNSLNFDGGGERFVPGVCIVCHQSYNGPRDYSDVSQADLGAVFMPWDLDSFLYSKADNPELVEPTLNPADFSPELIDKYSRENQEAELRKLNLGALATYVGDPDRHSASIDLIHGWYGDTDNELPIDELPDTVFDGSYVPEGWAGQEELYLGVFARTCRICHTQVGTQAGSLISNDEKNFDSYQEFIDKKDIIRNYVFEQGLMPIARVSFDRFWVDYNGGESSADLLRSHLEGLGDVIPEAPGLPVPNFLFDRETATIGETISVNGAASVFSESYSWALTTPAGSTSTLNNSSGVTSSFSADQPGGSYDITLTTTNKNGVTASFTNTFVIDNRVPIAECLTANSSSMTPAGTLSNIPVVSLINSLGDGGVIVDSVIDGSLGTVTIDAQAQTISYQLNDPFDRGVDTIEYQLADFDGSLSSTANGCASSTDGFATITIDSSISGTGAPASATATVDAINNTTEIDVSWTAPPGITPDGYNVYRNTTASGSPLNDSLLTGTSFSDDNNGTGLTAGTSYNYSVVSIINGFSSQPTTAAPASTLSLTPTGLTATNDGSATIDETQIDLSWTIPAAGSATVDDYTIYRDSLAIDTSATNSYTDIGLTPGTSYSYQVTANDSLQDSPLSNTSTQSTRPIAPSALGLIAGADARTDITLNWTAPSSGNFDVFAVYRDSLEIARVGTTSYADNGLSANTNYSYFVTSISANGDTNLEKESADSNTANLTTAAAGAGSVTNLTATLDSTNDATEIDLTWVAPTAFTPSGYNLYRSINDGNYDFLVTTTATNYTDSNLNNATKYEYQIAPISGATENTADRTGETLAATATTLSLEPTALTAGTISASAIDFSWTSPTATETTSVTRGVDGINFPNAISTGCCSVSDGTVSSGTAYVYRVTGTQGSDSASAIISLASRPNDPGTLSVTSNSTNQINLSWIASSGNVDSYNVYRSDDGFVSSTTQNVIAPTITLNSTSLSSGTDYEYRVYAVANGVESSNFQSVSETTIPDAPSLSSTGNTTSQISLRWTASSGDIDNYRIYRSNDLSSPVQTTNAATTTATIASLVAGTEYTYVVRAVAGGNESASSNTVTVSTIPEAPTVTAENEADTSTTSITVRWTPGTDGNATYEVFFGSASVAVTAANATSATISGLLSATTNTVTVRASVNGEESASSNAEDYQTDVLFSDVIAQPFYTQPTTPYTNCSSCHLFTATDYHSQGACLTNGDSSLAECDDLGVTPNDMDAYTITPLEEALIREWQLDGSNP
jgi:hypothetical protein